MDKDTVESRIDRANSYFYRVMTQGRKAFRLPGPLFHIWHAKASKDRLKRNRQLLKTSVH
jgi:hypothetical protein